MATRDIHDIQIGQDRWIKYVDVQGRLDRAVEIDHLISTIKPFWDALATVCVPECCGINALGLYPAEIGRASRVMSREKLNPSLDSVLKFIKESPSDTFVSRILNNYFDRSVLLQLIEHIRSNIDSEDWDFEKESLPTSPKTD